MTVSQDSTKLGFPDVPVATASPSQKDPNGLIRRDLEHLKRVFGAKIYSPDDTIQTIMYQEGQQSVLDYIERSMVARR